MAVALIDKNYNTGCCIFAIDTESDLVKLPKLNSAGKDNLSMISSCSQGSKAYGSNNKIYVLTGDNIWIKYTGSTSTGGSTGDIVEVGTTNYNELENIPIKNLVGTDNNVVVLFDLTSGIYNISGNCKINKSSEMFIESENNDLYVIDNKTKTVRKLTGVNLETYKEDINGNIVKQDMVTTESVKNIVDEKFNEQFDKNAISVQDIQKLF